MNMEVKKINLGYFNHAAATTHPDKTALIDLSREEDHVLTHSELDYRMDSVATLLTKLGMSAGDRLLLAMGNRFEFIEIFFINLPLIIFIKYKYCIQNRRYLHK